MNEISVWQLCLEGGWIMIPLALLALISIFILIERMIAMRRAGDADDAFMKRVRDYVAAGETESAMRLCRSTDTPYSRLILKGLQNMGRPLSDVLVTIENTGNLEVAALSKGLPWLATTAAGAPMLGFLGTVIGMVKAFFAIHQAGNTASIGDFAGGIYTALVTTVAGLVVGIIALFAYNYLVARISTIVNRLEAKTLEFADILGNVQP